MSGGARALRVLAALGLALLGGPAPAAAQQAAPVRAVLTSPDAGSFPEVSVFLSVTDALGARLTGLTAAEVELLEDDLPQAGLRVDEVLVGARQVFAINSGPRMRLPAAGGQRYELVRRALLTWWRQPEAAAVALDDLTLLGADGVLVAHSSSAAELASALDRHAPTFEGSLADPDLLLRALDFLADPAPRPGMPGQVLFITPPIAPGRETAFANAAARALEIGARIDMVLVGPAEALDFPETATLRQLAEVTGGGFLLFDPAQGLAPLAPRLLGQRTQYRLSYTSTAGSSGSRTLRARVVAGESEALSSPASFGVTLLPPEVVFIDPPQAIDRSPDEAAERAADLVPSTQTLRLLIQFPDGYPRALSLSRLVVDGAPASIRVQPPFDALEWDLRAYERTGVHTVRAVVEDSLGLQGATADHTVSVRVTPPPGGLAAFRQALGPLAVALGLLVLGIAALAVLTGWRRRPPQGLSRPLRLYPRSLQNRGRLQRTTRPPAPEAVLDPVGRAAPDRAPIPLTGGDLTLGRDASLAAVALDDPSVAALHARVFRQVGGEYRIRDQGSIAGTWVNYEPVTESGRCLRHGDLIHIGRVALRFRRIPPPPPPPVHVHSLPPEQGLRP